MDMDELLNLKRQAIVQKEELDRTQQRISDLQKQLHQERQKRLADEERARQSNRKSQILKQITGNCLPGSEEHLLTLLKSGGFLEVDGDRILIKSTDRFNLPKSVSFEVGLPEVIRQQFPGFAAPQTEAPALKNNSKSSAEKLEGMTDQQLLLLMEKPQEMQELVNNF